MSADALPIRAQHLPRSARVALLLAGGFHVGHRADALVLEQLGSSEQAVLELAVELQTSTAQVSEPFGGRWIVKLPGRTGGLGNIVFRGGEDFAWRDHTEAWRSLACDLTATDLTRFHSIVLGALTRPREIAHAHEGEALASPSPRLLEGLAESLALLGNHGALIPLWAIDDRPASDWAEAIVQQLLTTDAARWATLSPWLPLLAEAGPRPFLKALLKSLELKERGASALLTDRSLRVEPHQLLHALQILGWDSSLMPQVARCLLYLLAVDPAPDRAVHPRPLSCLESLLGYAMPQTNASPEERLVVVSELAHDLELRDSARTMLLRLWSPGSMIIRSSAARPRYLAIDVPSEDKVTSGDAAYGQVKTYADLLVELAGDDPQHWANLVSATHVPSSIACNVLTQLIAKHGQIDDPDGRIWTRLRGTLDWLRRAGEPAKSQTAFVRRRHLTDEAYELFEPQDPIVRCAYLFAQQPTLDDGVSDYSTLGQRTLAHQKAALEQLWHRQDRWKQLARLAGLRTPPGEPDKPMVPWGLVLALVQTAFADPLEAKLSEGSTFAPFSAIAPAFLAYRFASRDIEETRSLLERLLNAGRSSDAHAFVTEASRVGQFEQQIWELLDTYDWAHALRRAYWQDTQGLWMRERPQDKQELAVDRLLEADNETEALMIASIGRECVSAPYLLRVLEKQAETFGSLQSDPEGLPGPFGREHHIIELLNRLAAATDVDFERVTRAELRLFNLLRRETTYEPKFISRAIAANPAWLTTLGQDDNRWSLVTYILDGWKGYPGEDRLRSDQGPTLENWCLELLRLMADDSAFAFMIIGTFLARPDPDEPDGLWPCRVARRFLDLLVTKPAHRTELMHSIMRERQDARGVTSRAVGEGGAQERTIATQYYQGAQRMRSKWPQTASMLDKLAKYYEGEARRHDEDAVDDAWRYQMPVQGNEDIKPGGPPLFPISRVKLENFRALRDVDLYLDPHLNVLIGLNASGKTTVLDALAAGLAEVNDALLGSNIGDKFVDSRIDRTVTWISPKESRQAEYLRLQFWGQSEPEAVESHRQANELLPSRNALRWIVEGRPRMGVRRATGEHLDHRPLQGPLLSVKQVLLRRDPGPPAVPIFAYYGTKRAISSEVIKQEATPPEDLPDGEWLLTRAAALDRALDAASDYKTLVSWWRSKQSEEDELQKEKGDFAARLPALEAVRRAVQLAVRATEEGGMRCVNPRIKSGRPGLIVDFDRGEGGPVETVELGQLSDGFRTHLALVMDLARRMVQANPPPDGNLNADGWGTRSRAVVLIDEVDLHLHPGWQRYVLKGLRDAFPNAQFIVTTHSPQVIATVTRQQVKLLSKGQVISDLYVEGRETNGLLEEIFSVARRPPEMQRQLRNLFALLDDEKFEDAARLLEALEGQLGPHDESVVRARWLLAMEGSGSQVEGAGEQ